MCPSAGTRAYISVRVAFCSSLKPTPNTAAPPMTSAALPVAASAARPAADSTTPGMSRPV
ncbi:MAG TPA: hypothetical protein VGM53_11415 [Streptosporangiaceae bacterium]